MFSLYQTIADIIQILEQHHATSLLQAYSRNSAIDYIIKENFQYFEQKDIQISLLHGSNPIDHKIYDRKISALNDCHANEFDFVLVYQYLHLLQKKEGLRFLKQCLQKSKKGVLVSILPPFHKNQQLLESQLSHWIMSDFSYFRYQKISKNSSFNEPLLFWLQPKDPLFTYNPPCKWNTSWRPLHIAYLLPHKNLTGGLKMLLQQMKFFQKKGHKIEVIYKSNDEKTGSIPDWFSFHPDKETIISESESYSSYLNDCDICICGWLTQLLELKNSSAKIMYWEQGNEWMFGDITTKKELVQQLLQESYQTHHFIASVSKFVKRILSNNFSRESYVLYNGIDREFYYPKEKDFGNHILLVGNPHLGFKGFETCLKALELLKKYQFPFQVTWVCQNIPKLPQKLDITFIKTPNQMDLAEIYRNADVLLFSSWYEGFGMPPLEAMASGTPVISTAGGGLQEYLIHGENALICQAGDYEEMAACLIYLFRTPALFLHLKNNGLRTAKRFDYHKMMDKFENCLFALLE